MDKFHYGSKITKIKRGHYRLGDLEFYRYFDGDLKGLWDIRVGYCDRGNPIVESCPFKTLKSAVHAAITRPVKSVNWR